MKVGILAGGLGSRLAEETEIKPKPMIEIGNRPILWHIMRGYAHYGYTDFAIGLGYKGEVIKRWLLEYSQLVGDLSVNLRSGVMRSDAEAVEDWNVDLVETGQGTATGGRIKRLQPFLSPNGETCMVTWGDGVSDVDIHALVEFHRSHGRLATLTAVRPPARFGHLHIEDGQIVEFTEKPQTGEGWINGAFFVFERGVFDYIDGDDMQFEREPLENLAKDGQLMAYEHTGFWQCMDTIRDRKLLDELWEQNPPWRVWTS